MYSFIFGIITENQLDVPVEDADDSSLQDIVELIIDDSPQAIPSDGTGILFENDSSSLKDADELFYCGDISSTLGQSLKSTICEDVCSNSLNQPQIDSENITHKILNKNDESETPSVLIFHNNIPEQQHQILRGNVFSDITNVGSFALSNSKNYLRHFKSHSVPELSDNYCSEGSENRNKPSRECPETAQIDFQASKNLKNKQAFEYLNLEIFATCIVKKKFGFDPLSDKDKEVSFDQSWDFIVFHLLSFEGEYHLLNNGWYDPSQQWSFRTSFRDQ